MCLSGRNGHGKSALLDAITWALWGQARKTTGTVKPDDGLLRLGARSMMVLFEFLVGGRLYRVRREFTLRQGNKPYLTLDVGVFDEQANQFHSLTDKTIRQTQDAIQRIIGLDYETYVNSTYLRQGNANEFSQKAPKDRKKILTAILGIDKYDTLQTRALERARDFDAQATLFKELVLRDEQELASLPAVYAQEKEKAELMQTFVAELAANEKARFVAQEAVAQCVAAGREHSLQSKALQEEMRMLREARVSWGAMVVRYREELVFMRSLKDPALAQASLRALRLADNSWRVKQREVFSIDQERMLNERELFARQQHVEQELAIARQEGVQRCAATALAVEQAISLEKQLAVQREQLHAEWSLLEKERGAAQEAARCAEQGLQHHKVIKERFDKRKTFYTTYVSRLRWLEEQAEMVVQRMGMVGSQSPSCPLCDQVLSAKRKQFLHDKLAKEQSRLVHQIARLQRVLTDLKQLLLHDHALFKEGEATQARVQALYAQLEVCAARQAHAQVRMAALDDALARAQKEVQVLQERAIALKRQHEQRLVEEEVVRSQDAELVALQAKIKACDERKVLIGYNNQEHTAVERELHKVEQEVATLEHLDERRQALAVLRGDITAKRQQLKEMAVRCSEKEAALKAAAPDERKRELMSAQLAHIEQAYGDVQRKKEVVARELGALMAHRVRLEELRVKVDQRRGDIERLEMQQHDCVTLAQAWGKNGIQALLIEQALPEVEAEANDLLARLTNNQAHIFIESLRDLKRGGARETLDIKIADSMGVRPYEMFSGGEAFRIDFALRIALSKLLAKRAGAHLQVLIIDEGFGSQDEEGLARLMQALYAVQDDFAKIIVVTHLPAFKENFPVHFMVEKGAAGSTVSVELRG